MCGQCSAIVRNNLKEQEKYKEMMLRKDATKTTQVVKRVCCEFGSDKHPCATLLSLLKRIINCKQGPKQSAHECAEEIVTRIEVIELASGPLRIGEKRALFKKIETSHNRHAGDKKRNSLVHRKTRSKSASDWNKVHLAATIAIQNSDSARFSKLKSEL